jgi:hypothetical protein
VRPLDSFPAFYGTRRFSAAFTRALGLSLSSQHHHILYLHDPSPHLLADICKDAVVSWRWQLKYEGLSWGRNWDTARRPWPAVWQQMSAVLFTLGINAFGAVTPCSLCRFFFTELVKWHLRPKYSALRTRVWSSFNELINFRDLRQAVNIFSGWQDTYRRAVYLSCRYKLIMEQLCIQLKYFLLLDKVSSCFNFRLPCLNASS